MGLTYAQDRPAAIRGLEIRLVQTMGGPGGFGIFRNHLHRYLLWMRAKGGLRRIMHFPPATRPPPSWSWMAYCGEIKYVDAPGAGIHWNQGLVWPELEPVSVENHVSSWLQAPVQEVVELENLGANSEREYWISMDGPEATIPTKARCVVVGTSTTETPYCYILLVEIVKIQPRKSPRQSMVYLRERRGKGRGRAL
jgi:hypothetical protein